MFKKMKNFSVFKIVRKEVNNLLKDSMLVFNINIEEVYLSAPTIYNVASGIETYAGEPYIGDTGLTGFSLLYTMELLQRAGANFVRLLKTDKRQQVLIVDCEDKTAVIPIDDCGICGETRYYKDCIQNVLNAIW